MKKKNQKLFSLLSLAVVFYLISASFPIEAAAYSSQVTETSAISERASVTQSHTEEDTVKVGSRLLELIFGKKENGQPSKNTLLCPGGDAFGVKICGSGVTVTKVVTELSSGALRVDDRILSINKNAVTTIQEVKDILHSCNGRALDVEIIRGGKKTAVKVIPTEAGGEYHLGVILSDGASGIGTITFYDPESLEFGGLGHGICSQNGEVLKMTRGTVTGVILAGAAKGEPSRPGELRGVLTDKNLGSVISNTECGVFGTLTDCPLTESRDAIPVACRDEIVPGEATIISTVKSGKKAEYKIEIKDIDYSSNGTKSFRIKVTDDTLIALTGGIVRGMSGSPIIQDGKLVGAVTHVMVADPTEGYGIFIENMLSAAEVMPKAA